MVNYLDKSVTSWQLPRLWGSYGEKCLMDFRNNCNCNYRNYRLMLHYEVKQRRSQLHKSSRTDMS